VKATLLARLRRIEERRAPNANGKVDIVGRLELIRERARQGSTPHPSPEHGAGVARASLEADVRLSGLSGWRGRVAAARLRVEERRGEDHRRVAEERAREVRAREDREQGKDAP
jgi:hypothetical protein